MFSNYGAWLTQHLTETLVLLLTILAALWLWMKYKYNFWQRHNVPYIRPNLLFGNFNGILLSEENPCRFFQNLYHHERAKNQAAVGVYTTCKPCLLIRDVELIKSIFIKDFDKFSNRYSTSDTHSDSLGADNLFFVKNPKWKEIRVKLTPVFTSGKIKQMFPLVDEVAQEYDKKLCSLPLDLTTNSTVIEVKDMNALYSTDVIALVAYGIRANSLRNPDGEFRTNGKRIFHFTRRRAFEFKALSFLPALVRICGFKVFSNETTKFLRDTISYVMEERIKSGTARNDLIDILVGWQQQAKAELEAGKKSFILERDCLVAQAAVFFSAGFETSSTTMSFSMYELSRRQDIQQRLRAEIRQALLQNNGQLTYETVMELKYLDMVVKEVLRLYPPLPFLDRECTLKPGEKGYSLKPYGLDFAIPHGMPVFIPICALHRDPEHFANPDVFDPDRFLPENSHKNNLHAYMPFGIGGHNCVGKRFGLLQVKVGLVHFFKNHYVTPCEKSHSEMEFDPRALILQSVGGLYCNVVRDPLL